MKEKKNKQGDTKTTYSDSDSQAKGEAILKDVKDYVESEINRKKAMLEEIKIYTEGKQMILVNSGK
jgi:hypothetical protein